VLKRFEENDLVNGKIVLAYFNNAYVLPVVRIENTVTLAGDGNIQQVKIINRYTGSCNPCIPREKKLSMYITRTIWYKLRYSELYGKIIRNKIKI
jgi:signal peptidase I